ncbi:keywimysin-related RiPP [Nocardia sp. N2S4-5]
MKPRNDIMLAYERPTLVRIGSFQEVTEGFSSFLPEFPFGDQNWPN